MEGRSTLREARRSALAALCALVALGASGVRADFPLPTNVSDVPPDQLGGQYIPHYINIPGQTPPKPPLPPADLQDYMPPKIGALLDSALGAGDIGGGDGGGDADVPADPPADAPVDPPGGGLQSALTSFIGGLPPAPSSATMGKYVLVLGALGGMVLSVVGIVVRIRRGARPSKPLASAEWTNVASYGSIGSLGLLSPRSRGPLRV